MDRDVQLEQVHRWRMKAEELRTGAGQMKNPSARASFLRMAETYDRVAENYENKLRAAGAGIPDAG